MDTYNSPDRGNDRMSPIRSSSKDRSPRRGGDDKDDKYRSSDRDGSGAINRLANTAEPSSILGIFGLAQRTSERDIKEEFEKFGKINRVDLIMDRKTGQSKCFAFVYFDNKEDAVRAKEDCQGLDIHGKKIRTDFSATKKAHDPTPGRYFGNPRNDNRRSPPRYSPYGGGRPGGGGGFREDRYGGRGGDRYREDRYGGRGGGEDRYREDRYGGRGGGGGGGYGGGRDEERDRYRSGGGGGGEERYSRNGGGGSSNGSRGGYSGGRDEERDRYRSGAPPSEDRYNSDRDRYGSNR